ncbi:MAG TPA: VOC family protein, partial [Usitatibacter sp.]|nr:VOC family protein [Usitatibacter sp.]
DAGPALAFFDAGGVRLMISAAEKGEFDHASSILYFEVPDIRAAHADLEGRGVHFRDEPHLVAKLPGREVWMCFFDDSEGNVLAITSEVAAP